MINFMELGTATFQDGIANGMDPGDAAQAAGSKIKGKLAGTFSDIGCFSTHPLKNFNAYGDGGFVITNNKTIYEKIKLMRVKYLKMKLRL